jgi:hypothetical protein
MTYEFQPGTIPWRVREHFKTLPAGAEISTAELTAAIGHEGLMLGPYLKTAIAHGEFKSRREGRLAYWRLGDGRPPVRPTIDGEEDDDDEPARPAAPQPKQRKAAAAEPASPRRSVAPDSAESPCDGAQTQITQTSLGDGPLRVALWSDGRLEIQFPFGQGVVFTPDHTRQLVDYLDRLAPPKDPQA